MTRKRKALLAFPVLVVLLLAINFLLPARAVESAAGLPQAELVIVEKGKRLLHLVRNGEVFQTYSISLGDAPVGHKQQEGDERTPEGRYVLDWRNPDSSFYKSIHISYPNAADRAAAEARGVDPGGMIMIHGRPNWDRQGLGETFFANNDWTDGCIAVSNEAMEAIWRTVENGTPIEIRP